MSGTLAQGTNLLSLFDHMIDDVIGQAQTQSTRVSLSNQRGYLFGDVEAAGEKFAIIRGLVGNKCV